MAYGLQNKCWFAIVDSTNTTYMVMLYLRYMSDRAAVSCVAAMLSLDHENSSLAAIILDRTVAM